MTRCKAYVDCFVLEFKKKLREINRKDERKFKNWSLFNVKRTFTPRRIESKKSRKTTKMVAKAFFINKLTFRYEGLGIKQV